MPPFSPRPDHRRLSPRSRTGASASCLLLTILAANQAAARDAPASLPYLQLSSPVALRFAAAPALRAPPPPLGRPAQPLPSTEPPPPTERPDNSPANLPADPLPAPTPPDAATPGAENPPTPTAPLTEPPPVTRGLPLLPDDFARPTPLSVEEFLPFFAPPPRPVSRATYEIK
jgi:hypothetical protein